MRKLHHFGIPVTNPVDGETHNDELHYVSIYDLVKLRPDSCGAHSHAPA